MPSGTSRVYGVEWDIVGRVSTGSSDGSTGGSGSGASGGGPTCGCGGVAAPPDMRACEIPGAIVCSEDGKRFGTCAMDHQAVMMSVGLGTACSRGRTEAA